MKTKYCDPKQLLSNSYIPRHGTTTNCGAGLRPAVHVREGVESMGVGQVHGRCTALWEEVRMAIVNV